MEDVGKLVPYLEQAARYIDVKTYIIAELVQKNICSNE
jgi:hypothetical protein